MLGHLWWLCRSVSQSIGKAIAYVSLDNIAETWGDLEMEWCCKKLQGMNMMIHDFGEDKDEEEMFLYGAYFTHIHPISARGAFLRLTGKLERHRLIRHPLLISSVAMNSLPKADPLKRVHPGFISPSTPDTCRGPSTLGA